MGATTKKEKLTDTEEINTLCTIIGALRKLDRNAMRRVLRYVSDRVGDDTNDTDEF